MNQCKHCVYNKPVKTHKKENPSYGTRCRQNVARNGLVKEGVEIPCTKQKLEL